MFYVGSHTRERIVTAEVRKLERRQAAERARRAAGAAQARAAGAGQAARSPRGRQDAH